MQQSLPIDDMMRDNDSDREGVVFWIRDTDDNLPFFLDART